MSLNEIKGTLGLEKMKILDNMSSSYQRDTTKVTRKQKIARKSVLKKVVNNKSTKDALMTHNSVIQKKIKRKKGIELHNLLHIGDIGL